jgi:hypothetical protein
MAHVLAPCPSCRRPIAISALACPGCGAPTPTGDRHDRRRTVERAVAVVAIVGLAVAAWYVFVILRAQDEGGLEGRCAIEAVQRGLTSVESDIFVKECVEARR